MPVQFSVVIPTHNRRDGLLQALASVRMQTRPAQQIIVVADGCTDGSAAAARGLGDQRIDVLELPKAPRLAWGHRNLALRRVTGDVVSYLGDDDVYLPDHLERIGLLHDIGRFSMVQAKAILVWPDGRFEPYDLDWGPPVLREEFLRGARHKNPMASVSHRRGLAEAAGGWNPDPPRGTLGDVDLFRRMLRHEPSTVHVNEPSVLLIEDRWDLPQAGQQAAELLARAASPAGLVLLRAEIGTHENRLMDETIRWYREQHAGALAWRESDLAAAQKWHEEEMDKAHKWHREEMDKAQRGHEEEMDKAQRGHEEMHKAQKGHERRWMSSWRAWRPR